MSVQELADNEREPVISSNCDQGIIELTKTKNFAKEPNLTKFLWELKKTPVKYQKKNH